MPREAIKMGAACEILDLQHIAGELTKRGHQLAVS